MKKVDPVKFLVKGLGKSEVTELAHQVNSDISFYNLLLDLIDRGEATQAMKASWILGTAARLDTAPAQSHALRLLKLLKTASIGGVQRELLKALEVVKFDENTEGEFVDYCFELIRRPGIDVGIRYYCLRILQQKVKRYPDLKDELYDALDGLQDWHNDVWKRHINKALQKLVTKKKRG